MIHADSLVTELNRLGVPFLTGGVKNSVASSLSSETLIVGLACHAEARLRLAVIPLWLVRPDYATVVPKIVASLVASDQITLKCFYTAACLLQKLHEAHLKARFGPQPILPSYFMEEFVFEPDSPVSQQLEQLGRIQKQRTGRNINWTATYQHAANRLLTRLEKEAQWTV